MYDGISLINARAVLDKRKSLSALLNRAVYTLPFASISSTIDLQERIEKLLGYPTHDPHGAPIPTREGVVETPEGTTLANLEPGDHALIQRVSDGDSSMLSHLGKLGMYPGTSVEMLEREPYGGSLRIRISGEDQTIGIELAENVFVSAAGETK